MTDRTDLEFGAGNRERSPDRSPAACQVWALLLVDAAEGLLSKAEQSVLDRHLAGCTGCSQELAAAQRGAAWLGLLKAHTPEPPPALLQNILARTTGSAAAGISAPATLKSVAGDQLAPAGSALSTHGGWPHHHGAAYALGRTSEGGDRTNGWFETGNGYVSALQPRLAMTTAMAFFSICLTLNLLGFSLRDVRAEALHPAGIQRTVADTSASLVRSFEGIRMVYRVESRVNEWRTANATQDTAPLSAR